MHNRSDSWIPSLCIPHFLITFTHLWSQTPYSSWNYRCCLWRPRLAAIKSSDRSDLGKERSDFGPSSLGLSLWWAKALLINQQRKLQLHYNPLPCQKQISNNESTANLGNVIRDRKRVLWSRMGWRIPKWKWVWWENLSFSITGSWKTAHHVYQGFGLTQMRLWKLRYSDRFDFLRLQRRNRTSWATKMNV